MPSIMRLQQTWVGYTLHGSAQEHCSLCVHYNTIGRREERCEIVLAQPEPIVPGGWCKRYRSSRPQQ